MCAEAPTKCDDAGKSRYALSLFPSHDFACMAFYCIYMARMVAFVSGGNITVIYSNLITHLIIYEKKFKCDTYRASVNRICNMNHNNEEIF